MKTRESNEIPQFESLDEEREYWEARGPLAEGHKGRFNKPKPGQKRSSFLAVRLTGEELTQLRDMAAEQGLGPSTFARLVLTSAVENRGKLPKRITLDQVKNMLEEMPHSLKDSANALARDTVAGNPDAPSYMIMTPSQMEQSAALFVELLSALLPRMGVQLITPDDARYEEVKDIVRA